MIISSCVGRPRRARRHGDENTGYKSSGGPLEKAYRWPFPLVRYGLAYYTNSELKEASTSDSLDVSSVKVQWSIGGNLNEMDTAHAPQNT